MAALYRESKMRAKIMVIEDERATRDSISFFLVAQGYNVVTAANGKEALAELDMCADLGTKIALIILDLRMPVMSGEEFLCQAKAVKNLPPVIVMSSCLEDFDPESCEGVRPAAVLRKPFREDLLLSEVNEVLDSRVGTRG